MTIERNHSDRRRWAWRGPLVLLAALLPTLSMAWQAAQLTPSEARSSRRSAREKILKKIPTDPAVLINVTGRDMPSSPDILNLGKRSTKALERCLSDNVEAHIRRTCAIVLEALGDRRALPTLHAALDDWEADVRHRVILALAAMPDPASVAPLLKLYRRKDERSFNRVAILHALGSISDKRVVRLLRSELRREPKDGESDMRAQVYDALWANRHLMARTTLVADTRYALRSEQNSLVHSATLACAELRSPRLVTALVALMEHPWEEIRNKAVYALGRIGDRKATKALLEHLPRVRESRMLNNIAFALERLDQDAFYRSMKDVIGHKQAVIRLNAAFVLGDVQHPKGLPLLQKALDDPSDYVRTSAVVAVGKLGDDKGAPALERFIGHPNLSVREEAIYALDRVSKGGRPDLIHDRLYKLPQHKHAGVVRRAAIALGKRGDERVRGYLLRCLENYRCRPHEVRSFFTAKANATSSGRLLLAWTRGRSDLTPLVSTLRPAGSLPMARSSLEAAWPMPRSTNTRISLMLLGALGQPSVRGLIERRANTTHTWPRIHARVALARLGHATAGERLLGELDNLPAEWLPGYVRALTRIEEPAARKALDDELKKRQADADTRVALAAAAVRLSWNPDDAIFRFLDALASPSAQERDLAQRYLLRNDDKHVTGLLRRALAREGREATRDRLRVLLDERG
jgi:HEAT repeat protein